MDIHILAEEFFDYATAIKGNTKATIRRYRGTIELFSRLTGIGRISEVTQDKVFNFFYLGRIDRDWSTRTYHTYHVSLLVFFRWCMTRGFLKVNPVESIEKPKLEKRLPKKLTQHTAQRLLDVIYNYPYAKRHGSFIRARNHAILATFLYSGLRQKELLSLHLTDVDLDNFTLFVRQGKGMKDRMVPISYPLAQSLKRYLSERNSLKKTCPEFFASSNRNVGFTPNGLKHLIQLIRTSSRVYVTPHMLRHTFATLMLEGGCDIYSLSKMMGHSDIKTTTIYLSASAEHLRSQIQKHPLNVI
ncbi:MAG: tyrosine-type recombinase/integrase [Chitinophagales bacterium]|nr:tyrosine-type recombinase/integrase [Chitinophagales bacterium]